MKTRYFFPALCTTGLGLLGSCAVYVPTIPSTPLLNKKGEVEITAGIRSLTSLETSVAWSPAPNLLLTGEAAVQTINGSETRNNATFDYQSTHRQAALGVGTYRLLGQNQAGYLGVVGGVGFASASIYDPKLTIIIPFSGPLTHYDARYLRYYGQVYIARQTPVVNYGASLRGTFVDYSHLQRNGETVAPLNRFYLEPTVFVRVGRRAVQGQATFGVSQPLHNDRSNPEHLNLAPVTTLVGVGIVVRPHLFRRSQAAERQR
ncbi:hypothetical protein Q5H92_09065 [Hymenobacter sp. M29]|uniref:Outer membrane protein beta-barrel domain-containing protein n=1 Tax=Hymenobacter mellowenesis TaxID=3063995 RepID=A0ABT9A9J4_9BACT|nr:hypothetical protein [Hymenobacter sp. M29]MDO7846505.1 hypothetical protein [Hymenobacter sp. M29]